MIDWTQLGAVINPFLYNLIYEVDEVAKTIFVEAVMPGSRSPKRWQDRS